MADGIQIDIVSPERQVFSDQAEAVSVPGREGYFTVMANHAPMMTTLKPGFVSVEGATRRTFYVQGGFAEITPEGLTVLAEQAKVASDFERGEIEAAIKAAQDELAKAQSAEARSVAQAVLDGWSNLIIEAEHLGQNIVQI